MSTGKRIKTGDLVKIISGTNKGEVKKVLKVLPKEQRAVLDGIGVRERHVKPTRFNKGGKKEIHVGIHLSKLAFVVDEKTSKTSRIGYAKKDGKTIRIARNYNNKEIAV
ncbi:MAG: 50S ribosomal protein L24 [Candidatus Nomurabacteria bacterium]|jgi:large subunit ribosomal protein L24|nr:50S ribosomal protein L24 [Candidatus Nomurabacteria bacterium]